MRKTSVCRFVLFLAAVLVVGQPNLLFADGTSKLNESAQVLREIESIPEKGIPPQLFRNAYAIAVIPGLIKAGFIAGIRYGTGVLSINQGGKWSNPLFISMGGGSIGFQAGAESTDIVLVFKTPRGIEAIKKGKFTLGADIAVAAGPVGRHAEASTDVQLRAEIYAYSRSRGLFGGVAIEGAVLQIDHDANGQFYGSKGWNPDDILAARVKAPVAANNFKKLLQTYSGSGGKKHR